MLDLLQETLQYINEQNDLLNNFKSIIAEKEATYKILHSKICATIFDVMKMKQSTVVVKKQASVTVVTAIAEVSENERFSKESEEEAAEQLMLNQSTVKYNEDNMGLDEISTNFSEQESEIESGSVSKKQQLQDNAEFEQNFDTELEDCQVTEPKDAQDSLTITTKNTKKRTDFTHESLCGSKVKFTKNSKGLFRCSYCRKWFDTVKLTEHMLSHTIKKPFRCTYCNQFYSTEASLVAHIRIHTGERPFKCSTCSGTFRLKCHLTSHIRTHTGEKPYQCTICPMSFSQHTHMRRHKLRHTGEKSYKCSSCSKAFFDNSGLRKHMRVHTREKPYVCKVCEKAFANQSNLKRHVSDVHTNHKD